MKAVVLAAGRGTRLGSLGDGRPKAMAPVAGKPLVHRVIETLPEGIDEILIVIGAWDEGMVEALAEDLPQDRPVRFVVQDRPTGTADALKRALPFLEDDVVVTACDSIASLDHVTELIQSHRSRHASATLSVMKADPVRLSRGSVVQLDGHRVAAIVEKPRPDQLLSDVASLPLYVLSPRILDLVCSVMPSPRGEYELQDALAAAIRSGRPVNGVFAASRIQVTTRTDLLAANLHYLDFGGSAIGAKAVVQSGDRVYFESGVVIGGDCAIGPRVYVERDARVGGGTRIRDALVLRGTVVESGSGARGRILG